MRFMIAILVLAAPLAGAASLEENFSTEPVGNGWRILGQSNLFQWNASNHNLQVTWDSSRPNSAFYYLLGTILNRSDDFGLALDLRLESSTGGVNPNKPSTFQLSFGFFNIDDLSGTNFSRGSGHNSPNLVEFNFYPDTGFGPTIWPAIWSTNSQPNYNGPDDYTILDLPVGVLMHVTMNYSASNQTVTTTITTNGVSVGDIHSVALSPSFTDFHAGAFGIESYSDEGQDPQYGGSLFATGVVSKVQISFPDPPVGNVSGRFEGGVWQVQFASRTNWLYTLERTVDLQSWLAVSQSTSGTGTTLTLLDSSGVLSTAAYRVRAERRP